MRSGRGILIYSAGQGLSLIKLSNYMSKYLTFTTLWANSADNKLMTFFLLFPENENWHFMQTVSNGDNLYEMSTPVSWEK